MMPIDWHDKHYFNLTQMKCGLTFNFGRKLAANVNSKISPAIYIFSIYSCTCHLLIRGKIFRYFKLGSTVASVIQGKQTSLKCN